MSLQKTLLKNSIYLGIADIYSRGIGFLLIIILARYLGEQGLGEYTFVFSLTGFLLLFGDFGMRAVLLRAVSRNDEKEEKYFRNVLGGKIILSAVFILITVILAFAVGKTYDITLAIIIVAIFQSTTILSNTYYSYLYGKNKTRECAIAIIAERTWSILGIIVALTLHMSAFWFIVIVGFGQLLQGLIYYLYGRKYISITPSFQVKFFLKKCLIAGLPFFFTAFFITLNNRIDVIMLSLIVGDSSTGIYSAAYKIVENLTFIPILIMGIVFPSLNYLYINDKQKLRKLFDVAFQVVMIIGLPITILSYIIAPHILTFMYGSTFTSAVSTFRILLIAQLFLFTTYCLGQLLNSTSKEKQFSLSIMITAIINIIVNLILIPIIGAQGAAYATVISSVTLGILLYYFSKNIAPIRALPMIKPAIATTIMGLITFSLVGKFHIVYTGLLALTVYVMVLTGLGLSKDQKTTMQTIYKEIRSKIS